MRDIHLYLKDIHDAILSIFNFIDKMTFDEFTSDDKTASAVVRKLEIIGEAVKAIPKDLREEHLEIPWREMAGMPSCRLTTTKGA